MTDIKCLEYDDEAAIIFIQKKLPKELNISDDDIQYVLEVIYDFYESKGWMIGKNHMKDWKAACRTWAKGRNKQTDSRKLPTGHILDWDVNKELKDKTSDTFWES